MVEVLAHLNAEQAQQKAEREARGSEYRKKLEARLSKKAGSGQTQAPASVQIEVSREDLSNLREIINSYTKNYFEEANKTIFTDDSPSQKDIKLFYILPLIRKYIKIVEIGDDGFEKKEGDVNSITIRIPDKQLNEILNYIKDYNKNELLHAEWSYFKKDINRIIREIETGTPGSTSRQKGFKKYVPVMFVVNVFKTFIDKFFDDLKGSIEKRNYSAIEGILKDGIGGLNRLESIEEVSTQDIRQVDKRTPEEQMEDLRGIIDEWKKVGGPMNAITPADVAEAFSQEIQKRRASVEEVANQIVQDIDGEVLGYEFRTAFPPYKFEDEEGDESTFTQEQPFTPEELAAQGEQAAADAAAAKAPTGVVHEEGGDEDPFGLAMPTVEIQESVYQGPSDEERSSRQQDEDNKINKDASELLEGPFKNLLFPEISEIIRNPGMFDNILSKANIEAGEGDKKMLTERFEEALNPEEYKTKLITEIEKYIDNPNFLIGKTESVEAVATFKNCEKVYLTEEIEKLLPDINEYKKKSREERQKEEEKAIENIKQLFLKDCTHGNRRVKEKIDEKIDDYVNNLVTERLESAKGELAGAAGRQGASALVDKLNRPLTPPSRRREEIAPAPPTENPSRPQDKKDLVSKLNQVIPMVAFMELYKVIDMVKQFKEDTKSLIGLLVNPKDLFLIKPLLQYNTTYTKDEHRAKHMSDAEKIRAMANDRPKGVVRSWDKLLDLLKNIGEKMVEMSLFNEKPAEDGEQSSHPTMFFRIINDSENPIKDIFMEKPKIEVYPGVRVASVGFDKLQTYPNKFDLANPGKITDSIVSLKPHEIKIKLEGSAREDQNELLHDAIIKALKNPDSRQKTHDLLVSNTYVSNTLFLRYITHAILYKIVYNLLLLDFKSPSSLKQTDDGEDIIQYTLEDPIKKYISLIQSNKGNFNFSIKDIELFTKGQNTDDVKKELDDIEDNLDELDGLSENNTLKNIYTFLKQRPVPKAGEGASLRETMVPVLEAHHKRQQTRESLRLQDAAKLLVSDLKP